jgi:hypothetical protein
LKRSQPYTFNTGMIYNLKADPFITGHSDIRNEEVAHAIVSAANS